MTDPGVLGYAVIAVVTVIVTYVLVPVAMRIALRFGMLDHPGGYKQQEDPVPYLGGAVIAFAVIGGLALVGLARPPGARATELWVILAVVAAVAVLGLVDDLKGLGPLPKLLGVLVAAAVLWLGGVRVDLVEVQAVNFAVTLFWVAGITNAMNLLDNMDGLSAGVGAIAALAFFGLAAGNGQYLVASLGLAVAGGAVGFLPHNTHPARIYMGDAGSLFLGVMLAVLGIKLRFPEVPRSIAALIPMAVLAVPILDTSVVLFSRLANGRPVSRGGRDHLSHRLIHVGVSVRATVTLIHAAVVASAWLALVLSRLRDPATAYLLASLAGALGLLVGLLLGTVPVYGQDRAHLRMTASTRRAPSGRAESSAADDDGTSRESSADSAALGS